MQEKEREKERETVTKEAGVDKKPISKRLKIAIIVSASVLGALIIGLVIFLISYFARTDAGPRVIYSHGDYDYIYLDAQTVEIVGYHGESKDISIPTVIDGCDVVSIGEKAFLDLKDLLSIRIGSSVTKIGSSAFAGCSTVATFELPEGLIEIGDFAFNGCLGITSITIPESVTTLGKGIFSGSGLTSIKLPASVTAIPENAFTSSTKLVTVELPETLKEIGASAFHSCNQLKTLDLPYIEVIGDSAFASCISLEEVSLGAKLKSVGDGMFADCGALKSVSVSGDNTSFTDEGGALVCIDTKTAIILPPLSGVTHYTFPSYVEHISDYAFGQNQTLVEVILPEGLKTIGYNAFNGDTELARIVLPDSAPECKMEFPDTVEYVGGTAFVQTLFYTTLSEEFTVIGDGILIKYVAQKDGGIYLS